MCRKKIMYILQIKRISGFTSGGRRENPIAYTGGELLSVVPGFSFV